MPNEVLISRAQADVLFGALLALGIVIAPTAFVLAKRRGHDGLPAAMLWGGAPFLVGVLWRVYNAITDRVGLDRVANLAINFALFVAVGAAFGWGWSVLAARRSGIAAEQEAEPEHG